MKEFKYESGKGFSNDPNLENIPEFGCTEFMDKFYDLLSIYPRNAETAEYFPRIELYEKMYCKSPVEYPPFCLIFSSPYSCQPVAIYHHTDVYELILKFLPLIQRDEHFTYMLKSDIQFKEIIDKNKDIYGDY